MSIKKSVEVTLDLSELAFADAIRELETSPATPEGDKALSILRQLSALIGDIDTLTTDFKLMTLQVIDDGGGVLSTVLTIPAETHTDQIARDELLKKPITQIDGFTVRAVKMLERAHCKTLGDVVKLSAADLGRIPRCGRDTIRSIAMVLNRHGLSLAEPE